MYGLHGEVEVVVSGLKQSFVHRRTMKTIL